MEAEWVSPDGKERVRIQGPSMDAINVHADRLDQKWMRTKKAESIVVNPKKDSTLREKGRAFAQGGTLGFQDELQAGLGAAMDIAGGLESPTDFLKAYRNHRDDEREAQDIYATRHPGENFALQMAGGAVLPGGAAVKGALKAPGWGRMARIGGTYGAGAGFGTAEGDPSAQALQTAGGGVAGAVTGVAAPFLTQAVGEAGRMAGGAAMAPLRRMAASSRAAYDVTQTPGPTRMQRMQDRYTGMLSEMGPAGTGPERARLMKRAEELGIELTPGERNNQSALRDMEAGHRSNPMSPIGWRLRQARDGNRAKVNNLTLRSIGAQQVGEVSEPIIARRAAELGRIFDAIERQLGTMKIDNQARRQLNELMSQASDPLDPNRKAMAVIRRLQSSQDFNQPITGTRLKRLRSKYQNAASKAWTNGDATMGEVYEGLVDVLEGVVDRQVVRKAGQFTSAQNVPKIWAQARKQWTVLKALRRPGSMRHGDVLAGNLSSALTKMDKRGYRDMGLIGRGSPQSDLYDALRMQQYFGDLVGDSGTATRSAYNSLDQASLLKMAGSAVTRGVLSPLGQGYMKYGTAGMLKPNALGAGTMSPVVGALSANQSLQGGAFGQDDDEQQ